jgi:hypothetical protein
MTWNFISFSVSFNTFQMCYRECESFVLRKRRTVNGRYFQRDTAANGSWVRRALRSLALGWEGEVTQGATTRKEVESRTPQREDWL